MSGRIFKLIVILGLISISATPSFAVFGEVFGDATITLQSHRYYSRWDITRFVYRVKSPATNIPDHWILGTGGCITEDQIDGYSSTAFTWADEPIVGLRFESTSKNDLFYLWLSGQWDVGSVATVVVFDAGSLYQGTIDGPLCEGSSISVEVASGASVEFPQVLGAGYFPALSNTQLIVSSTSSGWDLRLSPTFSIPENAQPSVVQRIFEVAISRHTVEAGATELTVSYALDVTDQDFAGLPEGAYVIGIVYTVTADD